MSIVSITAGEIKPANVRYAWDGRVPLGEPTILAGAPGLGKTQIAIGICARATTGKLPGALEGEPVKVAYASAEDSLEYTLAPRFIAAGGDPSRIHFFKSRNSSKSSDPTLRLPDDIPLLDQWISDTEARLLVLDPFIAFMPVALSAHKDQHVRRAYAPLAELCHARDVAALNIMHLNKDREAGALDRLSGSIGFGAAARSVLLFASDPDDPDGEQGSQRVLAHLKSNLGRKQPSIRYRIEQRIIESANGPVTTSIAVRTGDAHVSAGDLLGNAASSTEATARAEARDFLLSELADGPVATQTLKQHADDAGIAWRTLERIKRSENVRARKMGATWAWELNTVPITPPGGLDGIGGDESKTAKSAKTAGIEPTGGVTIDADTEAQRIQQKFGQTA